MYKVFPTAADSVLDAFGLLRFFPGRRGLRREFWSLRDVTFKAERGSRIGIIGRNGAGKSTLLKLITGSLQPTEGDIFVRGVVQALFEPGSGFHPEFTGYENIRSSLTYLGLTPAEISAAVDDIAEFTELGTFLSQRLKTYSLGMQARLGFATATAIRPDVLIVDEVLGAGDAYFALRSASRMRSLVEESGATVLIVSHAMDQITRYCDECVWLERGRILMRGKSLDVVNAYQAFINDLENRRLTALNRKRSQTSGESLDLFERVECRIESVGAAGKSFKLQRIALLRKGVVVDDLRVGDVQDSDPSHTAAVLLEDAAWSGPVSSTGGTYRELRTDPAGTFGRIQFSSYDGFAGQDLSLRLRYSADAGVHSILHVRNTNGATLLNEAPVPPSGSEWNEREYLLVPSVAKVPETLSPLAARTEPAGRAGLLRWASEGSLLFEDVAVVGVDSEVRSVFYRGDKLRIKGNLRVVRPGSYDLLIGATFFRHDGVVVTNLVSPLSSVVLGEGDVCAWELTLPEVNLGDGSYLVSLSAFDKTVAGESRFDLVARAYEFRVVDRDPVFADVVFRHPAHWTIGVGRNQMRG